MSILDQILEILRSYIDEEVEATSDLWMLDINSLTMMKVIMDVEKRFDIHIDTDNLRFDYIRYPENIVECVKERLQADGGKEN